LIDKNKIVDIWPAHLVLSAKILSRIYPVTVGRK